MVFKRFGQNNPENEFHRQWTSSNISDKLSALKLYPETKKRIFNLINSDSKIVEAGCGLGSWVIYLNGLGFDITGVDIDKHAVESLKEYDTNLKVITANVLSLPYKDNSYDLYLSFGVIEHFENGPDLALSEAHRVIKRGGFGIISVPNYDCKLLKNMPNNEGDKHFFQFEYNKDEFIEILKRNDFEIVEMFLYGFFPYLWSKLYFRSITKFNTPYYLNPIGKLFERIYRNKSNWNYGLMQAAVVKPI